MQNSLILRCSKSRSSLMFCFVLCCNFRFQQRLPSDIMFWWWTCLWNSLNILAIWITVWIWLSPPAESLPPSATRGLGHTLGPPFTVFRTLAWRAYMMHLHEAFQVPAVDRHHIAHEALESVWVQLPDIQTPVCMQAVNNTHEGHDTLTTLRTSSTTAILTC